MPATLPVIRGRAFVFGDYINSDQILPVRYIASQNVDEYKEHIMEGIDPAFHRRVAYGDFIVAGRNFGLGSSREQAASALRFAGIGAVIARSFAPAFLRNAINVGLLVIRCPNAVEAIEEGDTLAIDPERHIITNLLSGESFMYEGLPKSLEQIIRSGGLVEWVKKEREDKG
jgi:3-isopropylmalate dehydratase small subunit